MEQPVAVGMAAFHPNEGAWALPAGSVTQHRRSPDGRDVVGLSCARKVHRRCCVRVLVLLEAVPPPVQQGWDFSTAYRLESRQSSAQLYSPVLRDGGMVAFPQSKQ